MNPYMLIDFGSTFTKVTAVDVENATLLGSAKSFTTIKDGILEGLKDATNKLEEVTGINRYTKKLAVSSAAGGLKMVAVGLVEELTAKAAKEAALSAGAKVLKIFTMELTGEDLDEIAEMDPDIILLTGGTDGGNREVVYHNGKQLLKLKGNIPVIYAGNRSVKEALISSYKEEKKTLIPTKNVMPKLSELNIEPAREAIRQLFLDRIIEAKGIKDAEKMIDNVLMPTPLAVMKGAELLSKGTGDVKGIGDLLIVDIGGATTDVHSACDGYPDKANIVMKGLEEPFIKRSVEGDLGARYSLLSAIELFGTDLVAKQLNISEEEVEVTVKRLVASPKDINAKELDQIIAELVTYESIRRHAGKLIEHYTPFGKTYEQFGKNLTRVKTIIGTGGPLIHARDAKSILEKGLFNNEEPFTLKPKDVMFMLDKKYIIAAMGILAEEEPLVALKILKEHLKEI